MTEVGVGVNIGRKQEEQSLPVAIKTLDTETVVPLKAGTHTEKSDSKEPAWNSIVSVFKEMNALARVT